MLSLDGTYTALSLPVDVPVDMVLSAERQGRRKVTAQHRTKGTNDDHKNDTGNGKTRSVRQGHRYVGRSSP
jgi:hypothetical protein